MKTTPENKKPNFVRLPNGTWVRPSRIISLIPCGPDSIGDEWMTKPTLKILMMGKEKATCRFESNELRDEALEELMNQLN
jgi:hypothetical protein